MDTKASTLEERVRSYTLPDCHVYADEYDNCNGIECLPSTVTHGIKQWARADDVAYKKSTRIPQKACGQTMQLLRPFRGVHKKYLSGCVAVHECSINLKRISPTFISALVKVHSFNSGAWLQILKRCMKMRMAVFINFFRWVSENLCRILYAGPIFNFLKENRYEQQT